MDMHAGGRRESAFSATDDEHFAIRERCSMVTISRPQEIAPANPLGVFNDLTFFNEGDRLNYCRRQSCLVCTSQQRNGVLLCITTRSYLHDFGGCTAPMNKFRCINALPVILSWDVN